MPNPPAPARPVPCNTILQGDCLTVLPRQLPENCVDLTVFSPPYDGIREYGKNWKLDYQAVGQAIWRVTKERGVCVVVIGDGTKRYAKTLTSFRLAVNWVDVLGWRLFETCIYKRDGNPGAWWTHRFRVDHEYILVFVKGLRPATFNKQHLLVPSKHPGRVYSGTDRLTDGSLRRIEPKVVNPLKCRGTVWPYATSNSEGNDLKLQHPATFPDKLAEDLILCFSRPNDLVLDPMCGSGTTCAMAHRHGRHHLGIEISPAYAQIARARVNQETPATQAAPL